MSSTNKLFYILLICASICLIIFLSIPSTNSIHTNSDIDQQYSMYVRLNDSLNREIEILNGTISRLNEVIDSSRNKIVYIEKIRYEKINNIDSLTSDSILSLLTNYLSAKSKNGK